MAGLAQAAPPTNTEPPSIQGTAQEGQTLSYAPGTWTVPSGTTVAGEWQECDPTCEDIPGTANQASYTLGPGNVGDTIRILETATNSNDPEVQAPSNALGPITAPSATSLTVSPGVPVTDRAITLFATVTFDAGSSPRSGSLTFAADGTPISGCSGLGVASTGQSVTTTCQTAFPASTVSLTAAFKPAPGTFLTASISPARTVVIEKAPSSTSLGAPARVNVGSRATYTATVTAMSSGGPVRPSGTVTFLDRGKPIAGCSDRAVISRSANCTRKYARVGKHRITVVYGGDRNFAGSGSSTHNVTVTRTATGDVTSYLSWTFDYEPSYTTVAGLVVAGLVRGTSISARCTGRGCPFRHHTTVVKSSGRCRRQHKRCATPKTVNLKSIFDRSHLRVGTQIMVRIAHRGWVGKYYKFTIRSGKRPRIQESCLAVGSTRAGVGCS